MEEEKQPRRIEVGKITYEILMQHFHPDSEHRFIPLTDGTYTASYSAGNQNFIEFSRVNTEPPPKLTLEELRERRFAKKGNSDSGWKFHVNMNPTFYGPSCDLIYDVLSNNNVKGFKFVNPHSEQFGELLQSGRGITIYAFKEPNRSFVQTDQNNNNNTQEPWEIVLAEINSALESSFIIPGPAAQGSSGGGTNERSLFTTPYITYRYDDRPQNIGGMGKIGSTMNPDSDLEEGFVGGIGPRQININFLNTSQQNNVSQKIINTGESEDTTSYSSYQSVNFKNFINREKRRELRKNNTNNYDDTEDTKESKSTWTRSESPGKEKEPESQSTAKKNTQNEEGCQPEPKNENNPKDPDKDPDKDNDKSTSKGFTIGTRTGRI